ncbi:hypothetical protein SteCoe_18784 [Stentor coeruleus]|uniref:Polycystin domain-containing protein n=1 Tax=Stentor coeruleus TaxID=5963 RepID=A0A1R2BW07_9CILI|nr:hypothetical protein SteCoe_18784 [Stentor coeruleus]
MGDQTGEMSALSYKLEKKKEKLSNLNFELKKLERDKLIKTNQLINSESMLTEIQVKILEANLGISKLITSNQEREENNEDNIAKFTEDRDLQEIDKKLNEQLKDLAVKRLPLIPVRQKTIRDYKLDEKNDKNESKLMTIHSVKVLFLKGVKDGEVQKVDRNNAYEVPIRLLKNTIFKDVKSLACEYWELDENEYSLRAFNFSLIEYIKDPVEIFIKEQKMSPELWLIQKDINTLKALTPPGDYFTEESSKNQFAKNDRRRETELDNDGKIENYKKFLESFEGIKLHLPETSLINENHEINRLESWELNIFTFIITIIIITLTVAIHYGLGDFPTRYWVSYQMRYTFKNTMNYDTIKTVSDIQSFLIDSIVPLYFLQSNNQENPYNKQYISVGTLKIRFLRTKEIDCTGELFDIENPKCYESIYNSNTLANYPDNFQDYTTADSNNITSKIQGEFSEYDGSGYTWDFYATEDNRESFLTSFTENDLFAVNDLRAVIISFTHYSPSYDYWIFTQILIENSVLGSVYPHPIYPKIFKASLFNSHYQFYLALFFIKALLTLYFVFYYFYYAFRRDKYGKRTIGYLISYRGIQDLFMSMLSFVSLGYAFSVKCDENKILNSKYYYDFTDISENFESAIILNAWSSIFIAFRVINSLSINRRIYIIKMNIEIACKGIIFYILMTFPLMIGFVFVAWTVWGPYYIQFRRFGLTLFSNILFSIGIGNSSLLIKLNLFWTVAFYTIYLIFLIFITICAFIGIYIDAYREIKLYHGYVDDKKVWSFLDYMLWVLGCFNQKKMRQKIEDWVKARKIKALEAEKAEKDENNKADDGVAGK